MIKKLTILCMMLCMVFSCSSCNIKKTSKTTPSNMIACINYYPIESYMIDEKLYVEVERLSDYGFDVKKNENDYTISFSDKELNPKHNAKYYSQKELKKQSKVYNETTKKATLLDTIVIEGYEIDGKFCIPFDALKEISYGSEYLTDVKNIIFGEIKGMGNRLDYKYIKHTLP